MLIFNTYYKECGHTITDKRKIGSKNVNKTKEQLIEEYKDGFDETAFKEKYTEYFEPYDYIIGDWSYGKLRLKGFCTKLNKICNKINDIKFKDDYIKNLCSYECKYFVLEKLKDVK